MFDLDDEDLDCCSNNNCKPISDVVDEYLQQLEYEYQNQSDSDKYRYIGKKTLNGLSIGIKEVDDFTGGLAGGEILILATTQMVRGEQFLVNCIYNVANQIAQTFSQKEEFVLYFNFRSNSLDVLRMLTKLSNKLKETETFEYSMEVLNSKIFEKVAHSVKKISNLPILICDNFGIGYSVDEIKNEISNCYLKKRIKFIVINNLHNIGYNIKDYAPIIKQFKEVAEYYNVPILILSYSKSPYLPYMRQYLKDFSNIDKIFLLKYYYQDLIDCKPKKRKNEKEETFRKRYKEWEKECVESKNECCIDIIDKKSTLGNQIAFCYYDGNIGEFGDLCPSKNVDDIPF